jgi:hypothetical protein
MLMVGMKATAGTVEMLGTVGMLGTVEMSGMVGMVGALWLYRYIAICELGCPH